MPSTPSPIRGAMKTRTTIPLVPVFSGVNDEDLVFYGTCRDYRVTVRPDDEHVPDEGEDQRWLLVIDAPDPAAGPP
jgi:hypothetical protein